MIKVVQVSSVQDIHGAKPVPECGFSEMSLANGFQRARYSVKTRINDAVKQAGGVNPVVSSIKYRFNDIYKNFAGGFCPSCQAQFLTDRGLSLILTEFISL